jgi:hypothetical protein
VAAVSKPNSGVIGILAAILAVVVVIASGYWLIVVNGPTPVVKARSSEPGS